MREKDEKVLELIYNFCANHCGEYMCCPEEECVLWNIEQVILEEKNER